MQIRLEDIINFSMKLKMMIVATTNRLFSENDPHNCVVQP